MQYDDQDQDNADIMQLAQEGIKHAYKNEKLMRTLERELLVPPTLFSRHLLSPTVRRLESVRRNRGSASEASVVYLHGKFGCGVVCCMTGCNCEDLFDEQGLRCSHLSCHVPLRCSLLSGTSMKKAHSSSIVTPNRVHSGTRSNERCHAPSSCN